jgi:hypothetical protein
MSPEEALKFLVIPLTQAGLSAELATVEGEELIVIRNSEKLVVGSIPLYGNPEADNID